MMKNIVTVIAICLLITNMSGCKENERVYFETEHTALNIWIGTQSAPVERITYNFAYQNDMDSIMFYARLSGVILDRPRTFTLEAVEGDTDKVGFEFGEYVLPAGGYLMQFPIYFKKPDNFNHFTATDGSIVFRMKANNEFGEGASGRNSITIVFKNAVGKPDNWDAEPGYPNYRELSYYFGTYSDVKYAFVIQTTGLSNFRIRNSANVAGEADNVISSTQAVYLNRECRKALDIYNANNAELLDEFDLPITFPNR